MSMVTTPLLQELHIVIWVQELFEVMQLEIAKIPNPVQLVHQIRLDMVTFSGPTNFLKKIDIL